MSLNQITTPKTIRLALALKREYVKYFFSGEYTHDNSTHVRAPGVEPQREFSLTTGEISALEWEAQQASWRAAHEGAQAAVAMEEHRLHTVCYSLPVPVLTKRTGARPSARFVCI